MINNNNRTTKKVSLNQGINEPKVEASSSSSVLINNEKETITEKKRNPHKGLFIILGIVAIMIVLGASGWGYISVRNRNATNKAIMQSLDQSFAQQYGTTGITVKQFMTSSKVYVVVWEDAKNTYVSWNIGGLWVTVYAQSLTSTIPSTTTTPTP